MSRITRLEIPALRFAERVLRSSTPVLRSGMRGSRVAIPHSRVAMRVMCFAVPETRIASHITQIPARLMRSPDLANRFTNRETCLPGCVEERLHGTHIGDNLLESP